MVNDDYILFLMIILLYYSILLSLKYFLLCFILLYMLGKNSWQNRKAAMESILNACEKSGHYLDYNKNTVEIYQ